MTASKTVADICRQCGQDYDRPKRSNRRRYCTPKCRRAAERKVRKAKGPAHRADESRNDPRLVAAPEGCPVARRDGYVHRGKLAAFERIGERFACELCSAPGEWSGAFWRYADGVAIPVCGSCSGVLLVIRNSGVDPTPLLLVLTGLDSASTHVVGGGTEQTPLRPDEGRDAAGIDPSLLALGSRLRTVAADAGAGEADALIALLVAFRWADKLASKVA